jgi:hypothetical protein
MSQINLNQLPPWYGDISRRMLERAEALSRAQYAPFRGPARVAPLNNDLNRAENLGRQEQTYMPYLNTAETAYGRAGASFPGNYQAYMNPYQQAVVDKINREGLKTFNEGIMPALDARFIKGGHFGGGIHRGLAERAARDTQQAISERQQEALARGYQQAAQIHASDMGRQLDIGRQYANLGQLRQAGHLADIATLESQGERARGIRQQDLDVGYRDYLRQTEYPWSQLSNLSAAVAGTPYSSQGMQYTHVPPEQQWNRAGQLGQLAGQLYGLNRNLGGRFKEGGSIKELKMNSGHPKSKKKVAKK